MDMMSYLMGKNSGGAKKGVKIEVVTELPETGEANVIYLVPKETEDENNIFDEYLYINDEWELIGTTDIDLSGYQPLLTAGDNITINNNVISSSVKQYFFDNSDTQENKLKVLNDFYHSYKKGEANALAVKKQIGNYPKMVLMSPSYVTPTRMEFGESYASFPSSSTDTYGIKYKYFLYVNLTLTIDETNDVVTNFSIVDNMLGFFPDNINYLLGMTNTNAYTPTGDYNPATKKYVDDAIAGVGGQTIQYETMPTASADYLGKIVQYTGTTDSNYTNGYFYVCVSETENDVTTYSWSNVEVQDVPDMSLYKSNVYFKNITLTSGSISSGVFNYNETDGEIIKILNNNASNNDVLLYLTTGDGFILYLPFLKNSFINHRTMQRSEGIIYSLNGLGSPSMALVGIRINITWDNNQENISNIVIRNDSYNFSGLKKILNESETIETAKETIYKISNISVYTSGTTYPQGRYVYKIENKLVKLYKANKTTSSIWYPAEWDTKTYMEYLSDKLVGGALNGSY